MLLIDKFCTIKVVMWQISQCILSVTQQLSSIIPSVKGARSPLSGDARNFPTGGLTLPTRGLKYGFQGIVSPTINEFIDKQPCVF